ncbi:hypothetical protein [Selenihalanaerobacter shriftii]|uniref:Carboxypeptidase regulatory-like domain-containing protein n=1 Tax=Selenihalanaerobacter shriftii TaxID=142842 RepID=A0A1T4LW50_9FIRM|nr:hypothetical protein [Selenihalanaerobacter shriftii]SJZ58963.1 hypothetical protein SAMN02745118_01273 [Selenihalanaerobacter shriftii]
MKRKTILLVILLLGLSIIISGCNGRGNLKVVVYDQQQNLMDDVYIGVYTSSYEKRIRFAYTHHGQAEFPGLSSGTYSLKVIGENLNENLKIHIKNQETRYIKITAN